MSDPNAPQFPVPGSPHTDLQLRDVYRRLSALESSGVGGGGAGARGPAGPPGIPGADAFGGKSWVGKIDYTGKPTSEDSTKRYSFVNIASVGVTPGNGWMHLDMGFMVFPDSSSYAGIRITVLGTASFAHWDAHYTPPGRPDGGDPMAPWVTTGRFTTWWPIYEFTMGVAPTGFYREGRVEVVEPEPLKPQPGSFGIGEYWPFVGANNGQERQSYAYFPINPIGADTIRVVASLPLDVLYCVNATFWGRYVEFPADGTMAMPFTKRCGVS